MKLIFEEEVVKSGPANETDSDEEGSQVSQSSFIYQP